MTTEVEAMIDFFLQELRRQPGVTIPDQATTAVMVAVHGQYGGERVYVPKLPKLQNMARMAQALEGNGHMTDGALAKECGVSLRTVVYQRPRRR